MGLEQYSPFVSLLAGVLSLGYLVVDEWRKRRTAVDGERRERVSLGAVLQEHEDTVVTAVTVFFIAGLAHWYTRSTDFFYPVLFWGTAAFVVVVVAVDEVGDG